MARIRSIKPEFWQDYQLAQLERDARLFYIGLWNEADDTGRFQAHPRRLLGVLFPYDDDLTEDSLRDHLLTLATSGRVILYVVDGEPYGQLTRFTEHQKINRPSPSKYPPPPDIDTLTEGSVSDHGGFIVDSLRTRKEQGTGNREKDLSSSDQPNVDLVRDVFDYWQTRCGHERATLTKDRRHKIRARLRVFSADDLKRAIDAAAEDPFYQGDNDRQTRYDFPETIFKTDATAERLMLKSTNGKRAEKVTTLKQGEVFR